MVVLPTPGRAPEDQAGKMAERDHAGQRAAGANEVVLADDLGQAGRAKTVGEGTAGAVGGVSAGRWGEEGGLGGLGHGLPRMIA